MKPDAYLLLVDDDPVLLRSTARAFGAAGYVVEVAFSAAECLRLARIRRPDLILLDVVLPDESGVEVCRRLKEEGETPSICVVLISGFQTSSGHQEQGLAAGADAYIVRPIGTQDLVARIGSLLRVQQARASLQEARASLRRGADTPAEARRPADAGSPIESPEQGQADSRTVRPGSIETTADLAATLARCFDELLTTIACNSSQVLEDPRLAPELRPCLTNVSLAATRGADLTLGLLHYSGQQVSHPRILDLNETIERLAARIRSALHETTVLDLQLAPGLPPILADPAMVEVTLRNLSDNARDAMPQGGRIVLQTQAIETASAEGARVRGSSSGRHLRLSVADTGCGMNATTRSRIFEPFFTTKQAGKGFGLGLATVQDIVRQHHGSIEVQSEPGHGSTFHIYFPVHEPSPA